MIQLHSGVPMLGASSRTSICLSAAGRSAYVSAAPSPPPARALLPRSHFRRGAPRRARPPPRARDRFCATRRRRATRRVFRHRRRLHRRHRRRCRARREHRQGCAEARAACTTIPGASSGTTSCSRSRWAAHDHLPMEVHVVRPLRAVVPRRHARPPSSASVRRAARRLRRRRGKRRSRAVEPADTFYRAEEYHQGVALAKATGRAMSARLHQ